MKEINKTLIFTIVLSIVVVIVAVFIQIYGQSKIGLKCSYLDPMIIDIFSFLAALFLIIEGFYRIYEHKKDKLKKQLTRSIRIAFGFSIFTLHAIQFLHK